MADPVIDEIKQRVDIADLISARVALKKTGRNLKGLCPFHDEKTPSFVVYPEQGSYHCFGCGRSGDAFTWVQETEQLDFGEALRLLAQRAGVELPQRRGNPKAVEHRQRLLAALTEAANFYHDQLLEVRTPEAQAARGYVESRGLTAATVERFGLGYAPDRWDSLLRHLRQRGHELDLAVKAGLLREGERGQYDLFRGRLLFPIRDVGGSVVGFGGRLLGEGQPKYLNSPQTPLFDKSTVLYGLDQARQTIRRDDQAVIVEGYMDAVIAHQHGYANAVAALGTALTEQQVRQLRRYSKNLVLALDADSAGQAATLRGLDVLHEALTSDAVPVPGARGLIRYEQVIQGEIRIAALPAGRDPDDVIRSDPQQWEALIESAKPVVEFAIEAAVAEGNPRTAREKSAVASRVFPLIGAVGDRIARAHYLGILAERLGVDEQTVHSAMAASLRGPRHRPTGGRKPTRSKSAESARVPTEQPPSAPLEEHFLVVLLSSPNLLPGLAYQPADADFQRPEFREVYRAVLRATADSAAALRAAPDAITAAAIRPTLDQSLWYHFDALVERSAARPPTTASQREADLIQAALRLRERTLLGTLRRTQALVAAAEQREREAGDAPQDDLGELLQRQVEVTNDLNRVWLALNRPPLYTAAPA